nr:hypothetical protein [Agromyces seonyuensis]
MIAAALGACGWFAVQRGWIDLSDKRKSTGGGSGSGVFGALDEVFAPARHEAQAELDRQAILPAPAPLPGDDDRGISFASRPAAREHDPDDERVARADRFKGSIRLELDPD